MSLCQEIIENELKTFRALPALKKKSFISSIVLSFIFIRNKRRLHFFFFFFFCFVLKAQCCNTWCCAEGQTCSSTPGECSSGKSLTDLLATTPTEHETFIYTGGEGACDQGSTNCEYSSGETKCCPFSYVSLWIWYVQILSFYSSYSSQLGRRSGCKHTHLAAWANWSNAFSFVPETEFTLLILALKSGFASDSPPPPPPVKTTWDSQPPSFKSLRTGLRRKLYRLFDLRKFIFHACLKGVWV